MPGGPEWYDCPEVYLDNGELLAKLDGVWLLVWERDESRHTPRHPPVYVRLGIADGGKVQPLGIYIGLVVGAEGDPIPGTGWNVRTRSGHGVNSSDLRGVSLERIGKAIASVPALRAFTGDDPSFRRRPGKGGYTAADLEPFAQVAQLLAAESRTWVADLAAHYDLDTASVYRRLHRCAELGVPVPAFQRRRRPPAAASAGTR